MSHAHHQQVERLRYEAALAQRQFNRVDPDNRLVASELEKRWEGALAELKQAEEAEATRTVSPPLLQALSSELQMAFRAIGQQLPTVWQQGRVPLGSELLLPDRKLLGHGAVRRGSPSR